MARVAATRTSKNGARKISTNQEDSQLEAISKLAYQFYVERGRLDGYDVEDWARAEAIIKKRKF